MLERSVRKLHYNICGVKIASDSENVGMRRRRGRRMSSNRSNGKEIVREGNLYNLILPILCLDSKKRRRDPHWLTEGVKGERRRSN